MVSYDGFFESLISLPNAKVKKRIKAFEADVSEGHVP